MLNTTRSHGTNPGLARRVASAAVALMIGVPCAHAVNVLTIGDSISYGEVFNGDTQVGSTGGYQQVLSGLLGPGFNFVGEYAGMEDFTHDWALTGNPASYQDFTGTYGKNFALPGGKLDTATTALGNVPIAPGAASGQSLAQRLSPADEPDIIVIHLGTNNVSSSSTSEFTPSELQALQNQYRALLTEVHDQFAGAKIMVSQIIPKAYRFQDNGNTDNTRKVRNNVAAYNQAVLDLVTSINTNSGDALFAALAGKISAVDLFKLDIDELVALGLSAGAQTAGQIDGDDYVDWLTNDLESELHPMTDSGRKINTALFGDTVHPDPFGYEIMGYGIYQGLLNASFLPEPASVTLLLGGTLLLAARRR